MNVVPQYKVLGPKNYDRIIHNKKNYAKRRDIGQAFDFEDKNLCNSFLPVTCSALGDSHIYTKHILAHDQHYYISERLAKNK